MKQKLGLGICILSCMSMVYAAPNDAFTTIPDFEPDQNLTLSGSIDYFKAKSKAKNDNQRDYQGVTLGAQYIINPEWYTDLNYWNRTIKYGQNNNDVHSWKIGLGYAPDFQIGQDSSIAFAISAWGNSSSHFDKSSASKYKEYRLTDFSMKNPQDWQLQMDGIFSQKLNEQNTFTIFANAAYSNVSVDSLKSTLVNKNCYFDIHVDPNNYLTGTLNKPCTIGNTIANEMTLSADAKVYGIDIKKDLNYNAVILGTGFNWQWNYQNFNTLFGYNFQYYLRDTSDQAFAGQQEVKSNHIVGLELNYALNDQTTLFLQNQYFKSSFVGAIPSLYNPITSSALDKGYDYISLGARFNIF